MNLKPVKKVAIYGSRRQEGCIDRLSDFIDSLCSAGIEVAIERKLAGVLTESGFRLPLHGARPCSAVPSDTDAVISAGGDGTFLRAARWIGSRQIPVIGINTGHLGFLADNSIESVDSLAARLAAGEGSIEERFVLEVIAPGLPDSAWPFALNEVAFLKGETTSMITASVEVDDYFLADYRADGLLVATPTGSTAYNLSVGGPIVDPAMECIILSPVAPHALTLRPLVTSGKAVVKAKVSARSAGFRLSIDGRSYPVPSDTEVTIRKAPYSVFVIRMPGDNFASTLRNKLLWGHSQVPG